MFRSFIAHNVTWGGWLDSSNSAISLQSQRVSQQHQRKATYQHLLQGHILYPLHGVHLQRTVQRQLLRQNVRAIYFNMSSCLPYEVLLLLLLTEVFEDIVLRAFRFWRHSSRVRMSVDVYRAKSVSQFSPRITLLRFWGKRWKRTLSWIKLPLLCNLQRWNRI